MTTIQLDECINNKKLAEDCNSEGLVTTRRFPGNMVGRSVKDPEMLKAFMGGPAPLLTTDTRLPTAHSVHIPNRHPGIVVLKHDGPDSMTIKIARDILVNIKNLIHDWNNMTFSNSIVEISESKIRVSRVVDGTLIQDPNIEFTDQDWRTEMLDTVARNAGL